MPVGQLDNAATKDDYADALTVQFAFPRRSFTLSVRVAAVYYRLAVMAPAGAGVVFEGTEHFLAPAHAGFHDASSEGFPPNSLFGGIMLRSAVSGVPAFVDVK